MIEIRRWGAVGATLSLLHCGTSTSSMLLVSEQTDARTSGRFATEGSEIEFFSERAGPLAGDVHVRAGALSYDVHYDYDGHVVRADGHGDALDPPSQRALLGAIHDLKDVFGPSEPNSALHEQMLLASLSLLRDSGGMTLEPKVFDLGTRQTEPSSTQSVVEKSLEDDGITCIQSGEWYAVSFDYGDNVVIDAEVQAGSHDCLGQCGPYCTQLTPWRMWTLDCLEHDVCCGVTGDDTCWAPFGECGDEYDAAMKDFLRGYDPLRKHCGG